MKNNFWLILNIIHFFKFKINRLLFFSPMELECCCLNVWDGEYNTVNIVLFSANKIADILYVSNNQMYVNINRHSHDLKQLRVTANYLI